MKKQFLFFILLCTSLFSFSQTDTIRLRNKDAPRRIVTDRPPQAAYFQLGGSGPILSANYDRRFGNRLNGLGFAAGLGFWGQSGISIFSVPVSLNYLLGRSTHFVEIAGGTTFVTASFDFYDSNSEQGSGFLHHANLGYRYQPANGGFFFRGGFSPLFASGGYLMSYYVGFGRAF
jgi:hypothetical protein